jgi:DGQHR domain-containing protein
MSQIAYPYLELPQPGGGFYATSISADKIVNRVSIKRRHDGGPQRDADPKRVDEIAKFARSENAIFPTPILISCDGRIIDTDEKVVNLDVGSPTPIGHVLDGQHRVMGLRKLDEAELAQITLLVVFVTGTDVYSDASIFLTINSNQKPVTKSLIYDLFSLDPKNSIEKTAHEIAQSLNGDQSSPFYKKIKMLGRKTLPTETISQAAFVDGLLPLIKQAGILRDYYDNNKSEIILRIMQNCFNGLRKAMPTEWTEPDYLLSKTVGYGGIMKALPIVIKFGQGKNDLSEEYFESIFKNLNTILIEKNLSITKQNFQTSNDAMIKLKELVIEALYM